MRHCSATGAAFAWKCLSFVALSANHRLPLTATSVHGGNPHANTTFSVREFRSTSAPSQHCGRDALHAAVVTAGAVSRIYKHCPVSGFKPRINHVAWDIAQGNDCAFCVIWMHK